MLDRVDPRKASQKEEPEPIGPTFRKALEERKLVRWGKGGKAGARSKATWLVTRGVI